MNEKREAPYSIRPDDQMKADLAELMRRLRVNRNQAVKRALRMAIDALQQKAMTEPSNT